MAYEIVDNNWNDFFYSLEEYVKKINKEGTKWENNKKKLIKDDIVDLVAKEFKGLKILEEKKLKEMIPTGEMKEFSVKKTKEGDTIQIIIENIDNFLKARVRKWLDPILPKDSKKLKTIILGTFPWVETLNENSKNKKNICYYLNSTNIFRLILWIIYDDKFKRGNNLAIKTYLEISKKIKNKDIHKWQKDFITEVGEVGIWDAVHICYIKPWSSKDKSRVCLVETWLPTDWKKIIFNWKKNKLSKFVHQKRTFGESSNYTFCSSTSRASTSNQWLKLFNWAYHLLVDNDKNLEILDTVNSNLINLIKRYESKDDFVETLYSMMALFNIWYAYKRGISFDEMIDEMINEIIRKNELEEDFFENLWKKLRDNVDLFLTWETDDEDDKKNNKNDDINNWNSSE